VWTESELAATVGPVARKHIKIILTYRTISFTTKGVYVMGWDFVLSCKKKKDMVEHIRKNYSISDYNVSGDEMWVIMINRDNTTLAVFLLQKDGNCWGFKNVSESEGPFYYDCPNSLISKVPCPDNQYAKEWRTRRLAYLAEKHATLSFKRQLQVGCRVKLANGWIVTVESLKPFEGRNADGKLIRIPKKMLIREIL
jgi:hypothetical protein